MTRTVVLASGNAGKLREINRILSGLDLLALAQTQLGVPEAEETGLSFVENSILKARNAARHARLPAIADDSGIEVDFLNGAPGIFSARYAGHGADDARNRQKLLDELQDVPTEKRGAHFVCVMAYLRHEHDPVPLIAQGRWRGRILFAARGASGFGYDPIFYVPTHDCSAAELPPDIKNAISHRGQALRGLLAALGELYR